MSEMLKTMLNRIEHNKNALKTKRYYVEDLISNEELIILVEEIERLNNLLKETSQTLSKQTTKAITLKSENKRLNNIINELEKWLKEKQFERIDNIGIYALYETAVQKLKELKGSDKK